MDIRGATVPLAEAQEATKKMPGGDWEHSGYQENRGGMKNSSHGSAMDERKHHTDPEERGRLGSEQQRACEERRVRTHEEQMMSGENQAGDGPLGPGRSRRTRTTRT